MIKVSGRRETVIAKEAERFFTELTQKQGTDVRDAILTLLRPKLYNLARFLDNQTTSACTKKAKSPSAFTGYARNRTPNNTSAS